MNPKQRDHAESKQPVRDHPESKQLRDRSESSTSFQMDPDDIERVTHHSQVYTVISKPFKQSERETKAKPHKSSSNIHDVPPSGGAQRGSKYGGAGPNLPSHKSASSILDGSPSGAHGGGSKYGGAGSNFLPSRPPPPNMLRKQASVENHLLSSSSKIGGRGPPMIPPPRPPSVPLGLIPDTNFADYEEVDDPSPLSSADNSPFHRGAGGGAPIQIKQVRAGQLKKSTMDGDKIMLDVRSPVSTQTQKGLEQQHRAGGPIAHAQKGGEHGQWKPIPAARPSNNLLKQPSPVGHFVRENKKQELHQKYSKIREEILRKQGMPSPDAPSPTSGQTRMGGASAADSASSHAPPRRPQPPRDRNAPIPLPPKTAKSAPLRKTSAPNHQKGSSLDPGLRMPRWNRISRSQWSLFRTASAKTTATITCG